MALYEYRCQQCGNRYEKIQKMNAVPDSACPKCGGPVERPINAPAFQFKGSGWYVNDYAKSGSKSGSSSDSNAGDSSSSESISASSDSKPASSESKPASTESKSASTDSKPASSSASSGSSGSTS